MSAAHEARDVPPIHTTTRRAGGARESTRTTRYESDVVSIYDTGLHALVCDSLRGPLDIVRLPSRRVRWFGGSACVCHADS